MTDMEKALTDKLLLSKKYRALCPDTVYRLAAQALSRHKNAKNAEHAAREALHQLTGAFMTPDEVKSARACLAAFVAGYQGALAQCLQLHASTRERPDAAGLFGRVLAKTGATGLVMDLACGLNPLALGGLGLRVWGLDVSGACISLINDWANAAGWDVRCQTGDLLCAPALPRAHLCLMMKLLPVLERQKSGAGERLLHESPARFKLVTFPTRTLGGRQVGMETHYAGWLEPRLGSLTLLDKWVSDNELCYLLEDHHG